MPKPDEQNPLSPTVLKVINQFVAAMRADEAIDGSAIDRLEKLLRQEGVPKPDEISAAMFGAPADGDS